MKEYSWGTPFGISSVIAKFNCQKCNEEIVTHEIEMPYPDFSAETGSDSQNSENDSIECTSCGEVYDITIVNGMYGGWFSIENLPDDYPVEFIEIEEDEHDYELEAILSNSEFKDTFDMAISNILCLNQIELPVDEQNKLLKRSLYSNIISAFEVYLSDAFINTIDKKDVKYLKNFVACYRKYKDEKIKKSEIFVLYDNIKRDAIKELKDITFHNIEVSKYLYYNTLNIEFPEDLSDMFKIVETRHDLIHRNGFSKNGDEIIVDSTIISETIGTVRHFVNFIDEQIVELD